MDRIVNDITIKFKELYGNTDNMRVYFSPGRVNLIGEHTDYNGGYVFPCALTIGTYAAVTLRKDQQIRFYSMNFEETGVILSNVNDVSERADEGNWTDYLKGIIWTFNEKGFSVNKGMDIVLYGNIPNASGLSSSASIEVLMGYILKDMFDFKVSELELALYGQYSENNYNNVKCGIMDQFACAMGKKGSAMFLDTASFEFKYVPVGLQGVKLIIACTNKKRGLAGSKYNERRFECEQALEELKRVIDIESLGDLNCEQFEQYKYAIKDSVRLMRARHAVYENQRTIEAVKALEKNDIVSFGNLMNESHRSLRDDYEVTGIELDTLVEAAWNTDGVIGARMTGAGFGGCTVNLVETSKVETFIDKVSNIYESKMGYSADFYVVDIGDGPRRIEV